MTREYIITINDKEYDIRKDKLPTYDPEEVVYGKLSGRNYLNITMPNNLYTLYIVMLLIKKGYFDIIDPVNDLSPDDFYFSEKIQRYVCNYNDYKEFFHMSKSKGIIYNLGPKKQSVFWVVPKTGIIINKDIIREKGLFHVALPEVTEEFREETLDFITVLEKNNNTTTINKIIHNNT